MVAHPEGEWGINGSRVVLDGNSCALGDVDMRAGGLGWVVRLNLRWGVRLDICRTFVIVIVICECGRCWGLSSHGYSGVINVVVGYR